MGGMWPLYRELRRSDVHLCTSHTRVAFPTGDGVLTFWQMAVLLSNEQFTRRRGEAGCRRRRPWSRDEQTTTRTCNEARRSVGAIHASAVGRDAGVRVHRSEERLNSSHGYISYAVF